MIIGNLDYDRWDLILYRNSSNALGFTYVAMIPTVLKLFHFKYALVKVGCLVPLTNNQDNTQSFVSST